MKVTIHNIGVCAGYLCPSCGGACSPGYNFCMYCGTDLQWGAGTKELHDERCRGVSVKNFIRRRERERNGYIFISHAELEEQNMGEVSDGRVYQLAYNGRLCYISVINNEGVCLTPIGKEKAVPSARRGTAK